MSLYAKSRLVTSLAALILLVPGQRTFAACAVIDDMEFYTPWIPEDHDIFMFWADGWGDCMAGAGNNTGCTVIENLEVVLGGFQSMQYDYDNDGIVYSPCTLELETREHKWSVARAELAELPSHITRDWTAGGIKLLSVPFHGKAGNAIEDLWIKLEDNLGTSAKVYYGESPGEDPCDMTVESWHLWTIELSRFTPGVNLANVHAMSIGVGQEGSTADGGSGTLYFDDISLCPPRYATIYVKSTAAGDNTGANWDDAFTSLSDALDTAIFGDRILVAEGTYHPAVEPSEPEPRKSQFAMKGGVAIHGGFPNAGDPNFHDRDPAEYPTILSGDIGIPGEPNDNCYHVVRDGGAGSAGILDGFTITGGNANGQFGDGKGAGMHIGHAAPTVVNCTFTANIANYGAAIYNGLENPLFVNCTFSANSGLYGGSVIDNFSGSPRIVNSILWGSHGTPIKNDRGSVIITYSHVEGGWPGNGNSQGDPLFVRNPSDGSDGWGIGDNDDLGDLRLQPQSPCIDAGDNASLPPETDGFHNIIDGDCNGVATVDMGAYEFDFTALGDIAADCDVDAEDYALLAA
ncbi:MAG: choice-of-anchor Q domain-containing protein, partial [Planctomycetota bacterium]